MGRGRRGGRRRDRVDSLSTGANRHGGLENTTAIIVRIDRVDAPVVGDTEITRPGVRD